ncbi:hypothetical protein [Streptomyces sp. 2A115]|uniref:hypothetical protein n=1 Tax=Streptomyces sp. 2A115 TaxID=3457439 RepID=UPI003FD671F8
MDPGTRTDIEPTLDDGRSGDSGAPTVTAARADLSDPGGERETADPEGNIVLGED